MAEERLTEAQLVLVSAVAAQKGAEAGAKIVLEYIEEYRKRAEDERNKKIAEMPDLRLHNVKLLLRNYRLLKAHAENAVYEWPCDETPQEILESLMIGRDDTVKVESIKKSAARTSIIVRHMETMMNLYHAYCVTCGSDGELRRWRVVSGLYIEEPRRTAPELAKTERVVERMIYKDVDAACETIAALMFGIDGLKKR